MRTGRLDWRAGCLRGGAFHALWLNPNLIHPRPQRADGGDINIDAYSDALVVLGTAGVVVPLVRRFGVSPVLGYLGAGAVLGPLGLGTFKEQVPVLYWFTVADADNVAGIAELGVVFLMFLIGLELSSSA